MEGLLVLFFVVIGRLAILALGRLSRGWRTRRILAVYPWRQQSGAVRVTKEKAVFVLPDPDSPDKTVSLKIVAGSFGPGPARRCRTMTTNSGTPVTPASPA
ncbi:hypothetical protein [Streptomyces bullii]|uniref:Uncharacterized protein n=1 Tax=Streptomyces bullii TaxID=349910 RepID=A0ABW0V3B1_9ACTN